MSEVLKIEDLSFGYSSSSVVLQINSFELNRSESVFLSGPSGSGKTTFLNLITGVLAPQSGELKALGFDMSREPSQRRDQFRGDHLGIVFQMFNLVPYLSVIDNVTLPARFSKKRREKALSKSQTLEDEAKRLLKELGLEAYLTKNVLDLSIGQQQRVAVCRALFGSPDLLIADEPTSALDEDLKEDFIRLFIEQQKRTQAASIFVSHDRRLAKYFDREIDIASWKP